ncbi:hypothetical protein EVAR_3758_1 [Eumeta japonica]|uniref:Uncharacterized protein n=1 Tax=Eumeta variegata TaxID=151549 RepID=A0A4C1SU47_EUMVA|nr:hypothetical protein EVAR_3758_1 [Eumeta japonica]
MKYIPNVGTNSLCGRCKRRSLRCLSRGLIVDVHISPCERIAVLDLSKPYRQGPRGGRLRKIIILERSWPRRRARTRAINIDRFSRVFFPLLFSVLNATYWLQFAQYI